MQELGRQRTLSLYVYGATKISMVPGRCLKHRREDPEAGRRLRRQLADHHGHRGRISHPEHPQVTFLSIEAFS